MSGIKLLPHLLSFAGMLLFLLRGLPGRRGLVLAASCLGFASGLGLALLLFRSSPGEFSYALIRDLVGAGFLLFFGVAVAAVYRSTGHDLPAGRFDRFTRGTTFAASAPFIAGLAAGAVCACRFTVSGGTPLVLSLMALALVLSIAAAWALERRLPEGLTVTPAALLAVLVALLLFSSSSLPRLDLFAPLTMKVMKFTHDFVHQFFESMLIPDHVFIRPYLWGYIGLLFGKEVGFWGGLAIWFLPALLVLLAIGLERLPQVSHMRQGAARRRVTAAAIRSRRFRMLVPLFAIVILVCSVYRSLFPNVEYWDPKPVPVVASPSGEIFLPKKGEFDLEDGKLHKFIYKQGGKEARFFVLMTPSGKLTVCLDACAICKPDGYGQAEGTVICYYCVTLIPLETVGLPGGCNPVPVQFTEKDDGVLLDGLTLINTWTSTIQSTSGAKGEGK